MNWGGADKRRDCFIREVIYKHFDILALKTTLYSSANLSHIDNIFCIALWVGATRTMSSAYANAPRKTSPIDSPGAYCFSVAAFFYTRGSSVRCESEYNLDSDSFGRQA